MMKIKVMQAKLFSVTVVLCTIFVICSFLVSEVYDLDVWWHLVIGKDILQNQQIPSVDVYSKAGYGRPYHDSHWLFQIFLALSFSTLGWAGVELFMVFIWAFTLLACAMSIRRHAPLVPTCLLLFFAAMACMERFLPRPEMVTYLMLSLFYWLLQEKKYWKSWHLMVFGLLQVLWTNSHGLFILGPFFVGCYWIHAFVQRTGQDPSEMRRLSLLLLFVVAATFVTPFGPSGWQYAFLLFTEVGSRAPLVMKSVGELNPTFGEQFLSSPAFWFFSTLLLFTLLLVAMGILKKKYPPVHRGLMVIGMAAAAITARRNVVLFVLVASPLIAEQIAQLQYFRAPKVQWWTVVSAAVIMTVSAWFPLSGEYYLHMEIPTRFGLGVTPSFFPHSLPEHLRNVGFRGQVFNSNTLGGFFLFHSYPDGLPLTDGRWEVYDDETLTRIQLASGDTNLWKWLVQTYAIKGILLHHTSIEARSLLPKLVSDMKWKLTYFDHAASFWMKSDIAGSIPSMKLQSLDLLPERPSRVDDCLMLDVFLSLTGSNRLRLANLERAVSLGLNRENHLVAMGLLQVELGQFVEAENTFSRVLRNHPRNIEALNQLSFLAYRKGELDTAEQMLLKALQIDPANRDLRANYQRIQYIRTRKNHD